MSEEEDFISATMKHKANEINNIYKKQALHKMIQRLNEEKEKEKEPNEKEPNEEEPKEEEPKEEPNEEPNEEEEEEKEQPGTSETRVTSRETKVSTNEPMENYNKIIDDFYKDNDAEKYFKRIKYLTIMLPESKFEEIAETEAEKLSQMNFNGVKLFKDIAEARQFLHDLRYGRRNRFKGQNQKFYKLPKIQKIINQSEQMKQIISPMMKRNIKPLTRTNYIYEY